MLLGFCTFDVTILRNLPALVLRSHPIQMFNEGAEVGLWIWDNVQVDQYSGTPFHPLHFTSAHRHPNSTLVELAKYRWCADSPQSSVPSKAKTSSYLTKQDMWRSWTLSRNPHCVEHSCLSPTMTPPSRDHLHLFLVNGLITLSTYTPLFVWSPYDVLHVFLLWVVFSQLPLVYVFTVSMPRPLPAFKFWLWICLWLLCLYLCLTHLSVLAMIFGRV